MNRIESCKAYLQRNNLPENWFDLPHVERYRVLGYELPTNENWDTIFTPEFYEQFNAIKLPHEEQSSSQTYSDENSNGQRDIMARARAYLKKTDPAISGQGGHDKTFWVACQLVIGFGLSFDEAYPLMLEYSARCVPPWTEKEIAHKLRDAEKKPGDRGHLLRNGRNGQHSPAPRDAPIFPEPIPASQLKKTENHEWLWSGYVGRGASTLFYALWKAGKTTFLAGLIKAFESDGVFCGRDCRQARVLYVTEENETTWTERRDRFGLSDHIEFLIQPLPAKPDYAGWIAFLNYLATLQEKRAFDVIILDTISDFWSCGDENDATQVVKCLKPMNKLKDQAALVVVHHNRKGDGGEATASRGSGAFPGWADVIMEYRRYMPSEQTDCRRIVTAYGRANDIPAELVIEWDKLNGFRGLGTRTEMKQIDVINELCVLLPKESPGLTVEQIIDAIDEPKPSKIAVFRALKSGVERGAVVRVGDGKRGLPFTYHIPSEL